MNDYKSNSKTKNRREQFKEVMIYNFKQNKKK